MSDIVPFPGKAGQSFTGTRLADNEPVKGTVTRVFGHDDVQVMFQYDVPAVPAVPEVPADGDAPAAPAVPAVPASVRKSPARIKASDYSLKFH